MRTRVKICGITRPEDALAVSSAGADAIGLVFYDKSPRNVTVEQARAICAVIPPFVSVVGLFVNASRAQVQTVLDYVPLSLLQFHGSESPEDCGGYRLPYIKAVAMKGDIDLVAETRRFPDASGYLLDAHLPDIFGGGGVVFDWSRLPESLDKPLILAGGLTPENIASAIRQVKPYAVDVSSGVEESKGIKSQASILAFIESVVNEDRE